MALDTELDEGRRADCMGFIIASIVSVKSHCQNGICNFYGEKACCYPLGLERERERRGEMNISHEVIKIPQLTKERKKKG